MRENNGKSKTAPRQRGGQQRDTVGALLSQPHDSRREPPRQPPTPRHGRVTGDVWRKTARASIHQMRVPRGWAVDTGDLDAAEACGALLVDIHDLERLAHYWAALATLRALGFVLDRGHGPQCALAIEHWRPARAEAEALALELATPEAVGVQLALFEAVTR